MNQIIDPLLSAIPSQPTLQIKIIDQRLGSLWPLPDYATIASAGMDLRAALTEPCSVAPNQTVLIPSGIAIYIENPLLCGLILPRSGLGHKHGIILGNSTGLIDADYQGELLISIWNRSINSYTVQPGDRIAQLVIIPIVRAQLHIVDEFSYSQRGQGGFGHTGTN